MTDPDARRKIIDEHFPTIVEEVLHYGEIVRGLTRAGLSPHEIRAHVLAAEEEVLAPADAKLDELLEPRKTRQAPFPDGRKARRRGLALMIGGALTVAGMAAVMLLVDPVVLGWFVTILFFTSGFGVTLVGWDTYVTAGSPRNWPEPDPEENLARWLRACRDDGVFPFVRRLINARLAPLLRVSLTVTEEDAPGLQGADDRAFTAATASVSRFLDAARRVPVGAIGISGPRGAGKTTLIEFYAGRPGALQVTVSAPVQYEPRDFVLHLFATVCRAIVREHSVRLITARRFRWLRKPTINELLVKLAREHLDTITFLQSHTTGWSGKVALPLRSEAGWSRQTQRERRTQTYPEIVTALRDLLARYTALMGSQRPAVVIAIDELDKIDSAEQVQRFLNEIKSVFGAEGTQFLVSVSEDALAAFERRGLPVRDAFDSAFHEIVRVDYLTLWDTAEVLSSRVIGLPEPFVWLVHCLSGGLPRDVIRTARAMLVGNETSPALDQVCARLVTEDLERKAHAFQLACRDFGDAPEVTTFIRALRRLSTDPPIDVLPALRVDGELATLSRQAATYVYYSATLLEVSRPTGSTSTSPAPSKRSRAPSSRWPSIRDSRGCWSTSSVRPGTCRPCRPTRAWPTARVGGTGRRGGRWSRPPWRPSRTRRRGSLCSPPVPVASRGPGGSAATLSVGRSGSSRSGRG